MRRYAKKTISLLLALLLALGMSPGTALALTAGGELPYEDGTAEENGRALRLSTASKKVTELSYRVASFNPESGRSEEYFGGVYEYGDTLEAVITESGSEEYTRTYQWYFNDSRSLVGAVRIDEADGESYTIGSGSIEGLPLDDGALFGKYIIVEVKQVAEDDSVSTLSYAGSYVVVRDLADKAENGASLFVASWDAEEDEMTVVYDGSAHEIENVSVSYSAEGSEYEFDLSDDPEYDNYGFSLGAYVRVVTTGEGAEASTEEVEIEGLPRDAGVYKRIVNGEGSYAGSITTAETLTITKRPLKIKATDQEITYGDSITEFSEDPDMASIVDEGEDSGLAPEDELSSLKLATDDESPTEDGTILPSKAVIVYRPDEEEDAIDVSANYDISYESGRLTIRKAAIPTEGENALSVEMSDWAYGDAAKEPVMSNVPEGAETSYTYFSAHINGEINVKTGATDGASEEGGKPVYPGRYTVLATVSSENYSTTSVSDEFVISKRYITIIAGSAEKTYDGTALSSDSYTIDESQGSKSLGEGDEIESLDFTGSQTDAGECANEASNARIIHKENPEDSEGVDVSKHYELSYTAGTLKVNVRNGGTFDEESGTWPEGSLPEGVEIDWPEFDAAYDGSEHSVSPVLSFNGSTLVEGTDYDISWQNNVNAGENSARADISMKGNFSGGATEYFSIAKRELKVTAAAKSMVYGESVPELEYSVEEGGLVGEDSLTGALVCLDDEGLAVSSESNVGEYDIEIGTLSAGSNYEIDYTGAKLTIQPADTLVLNVEGGSWTYDGEAHGITVDVSEGASLSYSIDGGASWITGIPYIKGVGELSVLVSAHKDNYVDKTLTEPVVLKVSRAVVEVYADDIEITYGDPNPTYTLSYEGFVEGEDESVLSTKPIGSCSYDSTQLNKRSAGEYTISLTRAEADNYSFNLHNGTLTVKRKPLVIVAGSAEKVYDGTALTESRYSLGKVEGGITVYNKVDSADRLTSVSISGSITDAGTVENKVTAYSIVDYRSADANDNYEVELIDGTLTVSPKALSLRWGETSFVYDGEAHKPEAALSGAIAGDGIALSVSGGESDAGSYTALAEISGNDKGNYTLPDNLSIDFEITKAASGMGTAAVSAVGGLKYSGILQELISVTGTPVGGKFVFSTDGGESFEEALPKAKDSGAYSVLYKIEGDENHEDSNVFGPLEIAIGKAELSVIPDSLTIFYKDEAPAYSVSYSGFVGADTAAVLETLPAISCEYAKGSPAGNYAISASGAQAANYEIKYYPGILSVVRKQQYEAGDFVVTVGNSVYDGSEKGATVAAAAGTNPGEISVSYVDEESGLGINGIPTAAGSYRVLLDVEETATHEEISGLTDESWLYEISKAPLMIKAENKNIEYGDAAPAYTLSYTGFVNGETAAALETLPAISCEYELGDSAGEYAIIPSGAEAKNYGIDYENGVLSVAKAEAHIVADSVEKNYGEEDPDFTATIEGTKFAGEDGIEYTIAREEGEDAGYYSIIVSGEEEQENYIVYFHEGGSLLINKIPYEGEDRSVDIILDNETAGFSYDISDMLPELQGDEVSSVSLTSSIPESGRPLEIEVESEEDACTIENGILHVDFKSAAGAGTEAELELGLETRNYIASYSLSFNIRVIAKAQGSEANSSAEIEQNEAAGLKLADDPSTEAALKTLAGEEAAKAAEKAGAASANVELVMEVSAADTPAGNAALIEGAESSASADVSIDETATITSENGLLTSEHSEIRDAGRVIELAFEYDNTKRSPMVVREHTDEDGNSSSVAFSRLVVRPAGTEADPYIEGTYYVDKAAGLIYVYSRYFSIYTIAYGSGYTLLYDANCEAAAGTLTTVADSFEEGVAKTLKTAAALTAENALFTREGYTLSGWNTLASPTAENPGLSLASGARISFSETAQAPYNDDLTLFAVWTKKSSSGSGSSGGSGGGSSKNSSTVVVDIEENKESGEEAEDGQESADSSEKKIASPEETGVSEWLITEEHIAYLGGYKNGTIIPQGNITRAEVAMIFYRLLRPEKKAGISASKTVSFHDVPDFEWFYEPVGALASLGILGGRASGFYPNDYISRGEFAALASRFAKAAEGKTSYSDVEDGFWAEKEIATASGYGWVEGYRDGSFKPYGYITRAEAATIINRMLGRSADKAYVDGQEGDALKSFTDLSDKAEWYYYELVEAANAHEYERAEDGSEVWK